MLQEVYSTLEALVDKMAVKAGHASLIYESTTKNLSKVSIELCGECEGLHC